MIQVMVVEIDGPLDAIGQQLTELARKGFKVAATFEHPTAGWCAILQKG
jgi:hypothetical protein